MSDRDLIDRRTLVHAPVGRDAELTQTVLARADIPAQICQSIDDLCAEVERGAGAIVLTEEVLDRPGLRQLARALEQQAAWSDIPVLLFAGGEQSRASQRTLETLELLRNVTLLDRPMRVTALVSTLRAALRARGASTSCAMTSTPGGARQAERASRLKDSSSTLSHELRTPLNAILGWIAIVQNGRSPRAPAAPSRSSAERRPQAQIVADVLDMSRIITGACNAMESVDLADVESAIDTVRPAADAKDKPSRSRGRSDPTGARRRTAPSAGVLESALERRQVHAAGGRIR